MVDCDRGLTSSESPRQDAPSPSFFLRASSLSLGSSFGSEGCWLVFKRRQFFTHSSLWSSSIIPQDASSSQGSLYFPLPLWNSRGRNSPSSLFHSRNKRVYNIPLRQWSYLLILLQMLAPHLCLSGSAWFHLWGEDHPETPSSGDEGGFLAPCLEVGREWVTLNLACRRTFITILNNCLKTLNVKSAWRYPSDKAIKSELLLYLLYIYNFKVFFILSQVLVFLQLISKCEGNLLMNLQNEVLF